MKISQLTTDEAISVLCELTPYLSNIASDEDLMAELRNTVKMQKGMTRAEMLAVGVDKFNKIVPIVLEKRKSDVFGILSIINEVSLEEIAKQNVLKTAKQVIDLLKDKDLMDFFKSCTATEGDE